MIEQYVHDFRVRRDGFASILLRFAFGVVQFFKHPVSARCLFVDALRVFELPVDSFAVVVSLLARCVSKYFVLHVVRHAFESSISILNLFKKNFDALA